MAKPDWGELQKRFLSEHTRTGISPKTWCEVRGLNYTSARRYIKKPTAQSAQKTAQKKLRNEVRTAQLGKSSETSSSKVSGGNCELRKNDVVRNTKRNSRSGNPSPLNQFQSGNQQALKHGGYARRLLLKDEVIEDAKALTLEDELFRLRANNLVAAENIGRWHTLLEDVMEEQQRKILMENISAAEKAMMRNTVRIESIVGTLATVGKIHADTDYRLAATDKVSLEADRLRRDAGINNGNRGGPLKTGTTNLTAEQAAEAYKKMMG